MWYDSTEISRHLLTSSDIFWHHPTSSDIFRHILTSSLNVRRDPTRYYMGSRFIIRDNRFEDVRRCLNVSEDGSSSSIHYCPPSMNFITCLLACYVSHLFCRKLYQEDYYDILTHDDECFMIIQAVRSSMRRSTKWRQRSLVPVWLSVIFCVLYM